jgi:hypothetical protein
MREIRDSGGRQFSVMEPHDLELAMGRLATKVGMWVLGTGLAMSFALGAYLTALRKDIQSAVERVNTVQHDVSELQRMDRFR